MPDTSPPPPRPLRPATRVGSPPPVGHRRSPAGPALALLALACLGTAGGCAGVRDYLLTPPGAEQPAEPFAMFRSAPEPPSWSEDFQAGRWSQAETALFGALEDAAVREVPAAETAELNLALSECQLRLGRPEQADATLERVTATAPAAAELDGPVSGRSAHFRFATVLERLGDAEGARRHFDLALEACRQSVALEDAGACNAERRELLGLLVAQGRFEDADQFMLDIIASTQNAFGSYDFRLASVLAEAFDFYARQGKYALAEPLFGRAWDVWTTTTPDSLQALERQALVLRKLGHRKAGEQAEALLAELWAADTAGAAAAEAAVDALDRDAEASLDSALTLLRAGQAARARGDLARAEELYPDALEHMLVVWPNLDAREQRRHLVEHLGLLANNAWLARAGKRFEQAAALYDRALRLAGQRLWHGDALVLDRLVDLATALREAGDLDGAEKVLARHLELVAEYRGINHPDYAWGQRQIGYVYYDRGRRDRAQALEQEARAVWQATEVAVPEL